MDNNFLTLFRAFIPVMSFLFGLCLIETLKRLPPPLIVRLLIGKYSVGVTLIIFVIQFQQIVRY